MNITKKKNHHSKNQYKCSICKDKRGAITGEYCRDNIKSAHYDDDLIRNSYVRSGGWSGGNGGNWINLDTGALGPSADIPFGTDVRVAGAYGNFVSLASVDGTILEDTISPDVPIITDVSVDANGKAIISWSCTAIDVDSFEIYKEVGQGWITIGIVPASTTTFL